MARKNLNDVIHGDRAVIRGYQTPAVRTYDAWQAESEPRLSASPSSHSICVTYYGSTKGGAPSCFHSHPALKLPGTKLTIYGGSTKKSGSSSKSKGLGKDAAETFTPIGNRGCIWA